MVWPISASMVKTLGVSANVGVATARASTMAMMASKCNFFIKSPF